MHTRTEVAGFSIAQMCWISLFSSSNSQWLLVVQEHYGHNMPLVTAALGHALHSMGDGLLEFLAHTERSKEILAQTARNPGMPLIQTLCTLSKAFGNKLRVDLPLFLTTFLWRPHCQIFSLAENQKTSNSSLFWLPSLGVYFKKKNCILGKCDLLWAEGWPEEINFGLNKDNWPEPLSVPLWESSNPNQISATETRCSHWPNGSKESKTSLSVGQR